MQRGMTIDSQMNRDYRRVVFAAGVEAGLRIVQRSLTKLCSRALSSPKPNRMVCPYMAEKRRPPVHAAVPSVTLWVIRHSTAGSHPWETQDKPPQTQSAGA